VDWWKSLKPSQRMRLWGVFFIFLSVLITSFLAWRGTGKNPPTPPESAALVILAAVCQIAGGWKLARVGYADPTLAVTATRNLVTLFGRVKEAESLAEQSFDGTTGKQREAFGRISVHLAYIGDGIAGAADVWRQVHPEALEMLNLNQDGEI
jgi:hypothetical protein